MRQNLDKVPFNPGSFPCQCPLKGEPDMMFQQAIVRKPCKALINGLTDHPELGAPDYEKALAQHAEYVKTLERLGAKVTVLEADENYPDSCFVEDVAVLCPECAVLTRPGAPSRAGEVEQMAPVLEQFYPKEKIFSLQPPATLEGGDVMKVGKQFFVGLSHRTNQEGINQLAQILAPYGYTVTAVPFEGVLHLKTGAVYLENGQMLMKNTFFDMPCFAEYKKMVVPDQEDYAANCVWFNGKVIVPAGYPTVLEMVKKAGYETVLCDTSEYKKIDGGLSCLSLRFSPQTENLAE